MKKVVMYLFSFIIVCFILPALLTKQNISSGADINETKEEIQEDTKQEYDYKKYGKIK